MNPMRRSLAVRLKIVVARLEQQVGWPGLAGLAVLAAAAVVIALDWPAPLTPRPSDVLVMEKGRGPVPLSASPTSAGDVPTLPPVTDVPLLLTRIQRVAIAQGLGWPRADYRLNAATNDMPASLDLRCVLKGPYPNLRRFVTEVLQDMPTLTLREFSLSRPNSDLADVEAKLSLVVYLSGQPPAAPGRSAETASSAGIK